MKSQQHSFQENMIAGFQSIKQYRKQDSYISRKQDINKTRFHVFKISFSIMPFQQV